MTLETFFEKFDQFADAPGAVAKMRELVLNFAVTGRLSEQRHSDEPVSELLIALSSAQAQRTKYKRRTSLLESPPTFVSSVPIVAPAHWAWVPLNEIGAMSGGMTPSKEKSVFWDGDVNWFSSKDIKSDELTESDLKITRQGADATGLQIYSPGCLVMVARSGILKRTFPVSILRAEGTVNQDLKVLTPFVSGMERYIQIMLRGLTDFILTALVKTGMTVQSLKYEEFAIQPFPLPPIAEQKRIVAKVDELMALCDRLEAQQQEREERHAALSRASLARFAEAPTPANLKLLFHPSYAIPPADLRKSILTLAVQGKLVPQDPNDEPADELLTIIAKQRAVLLGSDSLRKTKPCRLFTSDEAPHDVPKTWSWTMLGEITDIGTGSTPARTEASFWIAGTIPWITSGSTSHSPITEGDELVTPAAVKAHRLRIYPSGTLLVALYGQGKTRGQVAALEIPATINQACAAICPLDGIPSMQGYLRLLLEKQYDEMRSLSAGGAQPNLNVQKIKEVFVPLPSLAEQHRIVAKVERLMLMVSAIERQLAASRTTAANLLFALVAELTDQGAFQ